MSSHSSVAHEYAWYEKVISVINEEFNTVKSIINDLSDIDSILENSLIMVSAIPLDKETANQGVKQNQV